VCGIAGIVCVADRAQTPEREALVAMARALRHRGPDEFGIYRDVRGGLAHARLSIIDLSTGQQPLTNEDGTLWVSFNGEIFNYVELTAELERHGHRFRTRSDTEVIVHAYEEWGDDAFSRMNGQWAIALYSSRDRKLVLSRDRLGVRPLYVCEHAGRVYFASEAKAIFAADPAIPREVDPVGLEQTFTFWTVVPPQSVFRGIEELKPGTVRTYASGRTRERAYWAPAYPGKYDERGPPTDLEESVRAVRAALHEATSLRMLRADVPVGSYLSGGLDSSLVAALGRSVARDAFHTFSLRFEDAEYDETAFQRAMVAQLQSHHHEVVVSRRDIAAVFPDVVFHTERPILRTAPAPLFLLSRLVRRHGIKVVLTGEGADEMFAGYDLFREGKVRRFWARHPESRCRPRLFERLYPYLSRSPVAQQAMARQFFGRDLSRAREPGFAHRTRWETTGALKRLFSADVQDAVAARDVVAELLGDLPTELSTWSPLAQDQYIEIRTLLSGYLLSSQGDRMLMAHSVEGRFPFLDKNVVALAESLPPEHKLAGLDEKHVVKRAAAGLVPDAIVRRSKQPYRAPDALCFVGDDAPEYVPELLGERAVRDAGLFDPETVQMLYRKCRARASGGQFSNVDNMAVIGVLSAQLLHHHFVRENSAEGPTISLTTDVDRTFEGEGAR
jgi:asparagine synthase (glutamine-hydrolysing)